MNPRQTSAYLSPATYADEVDITTRVCLAFKGAVWSTLLSVNK